MKIFYYSKICFSLLIFCLIASKILAQDSILIPQIKKSTGKEKVELLNKYAASFVHHNPEERLHISAEALSYAQKINYTKGIADALNNCGVSYYYMHNYRSALLWYKKALPLFEELKDSNAIGGTFNNIANIFQKLRNIDSSIIYNKKALKIRLRIHSNAAASTSITNLGLLNLMKGNYEKALGNFQEALKIRKKEGLKYSIASSYNNIGALYWKWGNYTGALEYFEKSFQLSKEADYTSTKVIAEMNIGLINIDLGGLKFARNYINNAIKEAGSDGLEEAKANGYYYLAILYNKAGSYDSSIIMIDRSINYFNKVNNNNALSTLYTLEAKDYLLKKNLTRTEYAVLHALKEAQTANNKTLAASAYQVIGEMNLVKKDYYNALQNTFKSLKINIEKHRLENIVEDNKLLSDIYINMGNYKAAAECLQKYALSKDSLFNQKLAGNIANWRVRYQTANQENKILKLNKENSLRLAEILKQKALRNLFIIITVLVLILLAVVYYFFSKNKKMSTVINNTNIKLDEVNKKLEEQNKQLLNSNRTKDKLFSIIAHDLKGPFNGLLGLTGILSKEAGSMNEEKIIETTKLINRSSKRLFKLTKNLLDWSRIQIDSINASPELLNVKNIFEEIKESVKDSLEEKQISLTTTAKSSLSVYCDPQMLDTVLRNLVNNAIKFTNKEGKINLAAETGESGIKFRVIDNGIGIEAENLKLIFSENEFLSTKGTEGEHGTGLGIKICKELLQKCNSELKGQSTPGRGTEFSFVLPKSL